MTLRMRLLKTQIPVLALEAKKPLLIPLFSFSLFPLRDFAYFLPSENGHQFPAFMKTQVIELLTPTLFIL